MRDLAYFISDTHLGSKHNLNDRENEIRLVKWLDSIKDSAKEIYLLGDILDYWYEYKYVVPKGYIRFFGKLAELSDSGIKIYWFIGNHDIWIFDYFPSEIGIEVIDGISIKKILDKNFLLSHGDGVGKLSPGFKFIRNLFRNKLCQALYSAIHPRWTIPFALQCSSASRSSCKSKTEEAINQKNNNAIKILKDFSLSYNSEEINYFVYGHLHCVCNEKLKNGANFIVLGDWINYFSYGVFDGENFSIRYFNE